MRRTICESEEGKRTNGIPHPSIAIDSTEGGLRSEKIRAILFEASDIGIKEVEWCGDTLGRVDWYELMSDALRLGLENTLEADAFELANPCVALKVAEVTGNVRLRMPDHHSNERSRAQKGLRLLTEFGKTTELLEIVLDAGVEPSTRTSIGEGVPMTLNGRSGLIRIDRAGNVWSFGPGSTLLGDIGSSTLKEALETIEVIPILAQETCGIGTRGSGEGV
jgi:hypothetical protein